MTYLNLHGCLAKKTCILPQESDPISPREVHYSPVLLIDNFMHLQSIQRIIYRQPIRNAMYWGLSKLMVAHSVPPLSQDPILTRFLYAQRRR